MKKKIIFIISGIGASVGLLLMLAGFFLGGRPGSFGIQGGKWVYNNAREQFQMGDAPSSWNGTQLFNFGLLGDIFDDSDFDTNGTAHHSNTEESIELYPNKIPSTIQLDISAGYVEIIKGETAEIRVSGPIEYKSWFDGDVWRIESYYDISNIRWASNNWSTWPAFMIGSQNMTTYYTIVVPNADSSLKINLEMGNITLSDLSFKTADIYSDFGAINCSNSNFTNFSFYCDVGSIDLQNITADYCKLQSKTGSIDFSGDVKSRLEIDCDIGSVVAELSRPKEYGYNVSINLGSVTLDNMSFTSMEKKGSYSANPDIEPFFDIKCDLGSVEIIFK